MPGDITARLGVNLVVVGYVHSLIRTVQTIINEGKLINGGDINIPFRARII